MSELEQLFKIFAERNSQKKDADLEGYDSGAFFNDISKFYGFNKLPQVLEDGKFDAIDLPPLYHAFSNSENAKRYLTDENFVSDYNFLYSGLNVNNNSRDIFSLSLLDRISFVDNFMMSMGTPELTRYLPIKGI